MNKSQAIDASRIAELSAIQAAIKEATSKGHYSISVYGKSDWVIKQIQDLEYKIKKQDQYNQVIISWEP